MTKENSQRLYNYYVSIGKTKAAEDMLAKYPDFAEEVKAEKKQKSKKTDD